VERSRHGAADITRAQRTVQLCTVDTARCECGAAPARTNAGSARHENDWHGGGAAWNGRRRLGTARSVVEMAQSATGSARHSRCGGAQTGQLP
jgi:hypothetical protein